MIKDDLQIIKQHILKSDSNIDNTGLWQAYLRIVEFVMNTEQGAMGAALQSKAPLFPNRYG